MYTQDDMQELVEKQAIKIKQQEAEIKAMAKLIEAQQEYINLAREMIK